MTDRAVVFVDGNNWYHALKEAGVVDQIQLDWTKITKKLIGPRTWLGTRYYIGKVPQQGNSQLYADQRRFVSQLQRADHRLSVHFGRLEFRPARCEAAAELLDYLAKLPTRIDETVYHELVQIGRRHRGAQVLVEKAVDVMIAVDMAVMAFRKEYDAAYLLSADGDYTHAVDAARSQGCKVYAVSASPGAQLAKVANSFIRIDRDWFSDVYR